MSLEIRKNQEKERVGSDKTVSEVNFKIVFFQSIGFLGIIVWVWLDEVADLPRYFGAAPSPANIVEAIEETLIIAMFAVIVNFTTYKLLKAIKTLEGMVALCAFCKKIRVEGEWVKMEEFFTDRSELSFSHSFCPSCTREQYGIDIE